MSYSLEYWYTNSLGYPIDYYDQHSNAPKIDVAIEKFQKLALDYRERLFELKYEK